MQTLWTNKTLKYLVGCLVFPQQTPYWYFLVNFCRKISSTFTSYTHLSSSIVLICFSPSKLTTSAVVYFAALFATLIRASTSRLFSIYKDGFKVLQILKRTLGAFMVKNLGGRYSKADFKILRRPQIHLLFVTKILLFTLGTQGKRSCLGFAPILHSILFIRRNTQRNPITGNHSSTRRLTSGMNVDELSP